MQDVFSPLEITSEEGVNYEQCFIVDLDGNNKMLHQRWFAHTGYDDGPKEKIMSPDSKIKLDDRATKEKKVLVLENTDELRRLVKTNLLLHNKKKDEKRYVAFQEYAGQDGKQYLKIAIIFGLDRITYEEGEQAEKEFVDCVNRSRTADQCLKSKVELRVEFMSIFWSGMYRQLKETGKYDRVPAKYLLRAAVRDIYWSHSYLQTTSVEAYTEGSQYLYTNGLGIDLENDALGSVGNLKVFPIAKFKTCITCGAIANFMNSQQHYYCGIKCSL